MKSGCMYQNGGWICEVSVISEEYSMYIKQIFFLEYNQEHALRIMVHLTVGYQLNTGVPQLFNTFNPL